VAVLRAKGCSSRIKFRSVRKKVRDWVGLNAIVDSGEIESGNDSVEQRY
jgi:hypothetical protein